MNDALELLFGLVGPVVITIFLASITIFLVLRSSQKPQLFFFWIMGLHTLIVSALGLILIWNVLHSETGQSAAERDSQFASTVAICLGLGILAEGVLIYLICRIRPSSRTTLTAPSIFRSLFAALMGNALSLASFLIFTRIFDIFLSSGFPPLLRE